MIIEYSTLIKKTILMEKTIITSLISKFYK